MDLTERHAALGAAAGLFFGTALIELAIDFFEVVPARRRVPFVGHALLGADELQHLLRHGEQSFSSTSITNAWL